MNTGTTTTHTPGPWRVIFKNITDTPEVWAEPRPHQQYMIALLGRNDTLRPAEANARLIAAAPDLLAALEAAHAALTLAALGSSNAQQEARTAKARVEAAIAKARGEGE